MERFITTTARTLTVTLTVSSDSVRRWHYLS